MNRNISSGVAMKVVQRLTATPGPLSTLEMYNDNVAPELMERSGGVRYPAVHVYCEKIVNDLAEKFRSFSGSAQMTIELRHSSDKLAGLHHELAELAGAATGILAANRGDWGDGMFYAGAYQVAFGPAKHGGRNFLQIAKVTFEIGVSIN